MRIRNLLFGFVLSVMILFVGINSTAASPAAPSCMSECQSTYDACVSGCNGEPGCKAVCIQAYSCCKLLCMGGHCTD